MVRHLDQAQMETLLMSQLVGHLACHADGRTLVLPISYAYDGKRILLHSALGEKIRVMRTNPEVCFEVDRIGDIHDWESVVIQGVYRELEGSEASLAVSLLVDKLAPRKGGKPGASLKPIEGGETGAVVFSIDVKEMTGRCESCAPKRIAAETK